MTEGLIGISILEAIWSRLSDSDVSFVIWLRSWTRNLDLFCWKQLLLLVYRSLGRRLLLLVILCRSSTNTDVRRYHDTVKFWSGPLFKALPTVFIFHYTSSSHHFLHWFRITAIVTELRTRRRHSIWLKVRLRTHRPRLSISYRSMNAPPWKR